MAGMSIALGIGAFLMMFGGFVLSFIPFVGTILSFGAPVMALAGIVTGAVARSRASQIGEPDGAATAGLIVSVIAFIPALLVAVTCGLCNACMSAAVLDPNARRGRVWTTFPDGGAGWVRSRPQTLGPADAGREPAAPVPPTDPTAPPPALPPPPLPVAPPVEAADPPPPPAPPVAPP